MKRKKLSERILPDYTRGEEIFNMASHAAGVALGIVATVLCVVAAARGHNPMGVVTGAIFGASMILLYTNSWERPNDEDEDERAWQTFLKASKSSLRISYLL